jgi:2-hydroxycyclohexanecarboxyl-CoA dehydrogenase
MGRLAQPDEIAYGVSCFTAEDAGFISGQTLSVSGGLTMA